MNPDHPHPAFWHLGSAMFRSPTGVALTESPIGGASGEGVFHAIVADTGNGYLRMVTIQYPGGGASQVRDSKP